MPFVVVTAPPLADRAAERRALAGVATAVAAALDLAAGDVQVALVHVATAVLGDAPTTAWPVVTLHGRPRPAGPATAAVDAATAAVRAAWGAGDAWAAWGQSATSSTSNPSASAR